MSRFNRPGGASPARHDSRSLKLLLAAAVTATALAGGCVDQQKEVDNYRKVLGRDKQPAVKTEYSKGEELTLEAALLLANAGSEQLSIQGETYLQSLIARDRAYSAFMPTISLAPAVNWSNRRGGTSSVVNTGNTGTGTGTGGTGSTGGTSSGSVTGTGTSHGYTTFNAPIQGNMNLFNGFRDVSTLHANQFNVKSQQNTLVNLQQTVLLETAQSYYNVLLAEQSVQVLSYSVQYQDAFVQYQQNRFRAGIAQPLDVAQSEAQAAATRAQLITAEDSVKTNRAMLAFMTNAAVDNASLVDRLQVPEQIAGIDESVRIAEVERRDIVAAAEQVRVQQQNLQVAIGEYYPSISLDLNYYLHRDSFPTNVEWAGIITASVPIFSAGEIRADVRNAMSQLRTATYNEWLIIRQVRENVRIDWENLNASRRRIKELETEVAASQEALRQARERYTVGLAINLDVLNAITQLLSAQLSLVQERFNYKVFYLDLLRDIGRLPLPNSISSMSSGPASRPTTQELQPVAPGMPGLPPGATTQQQMYPPPAGLLPGAATQPAGSMPTTFPSLEPTTLPAIDFNLQPTVTPDIGPAVFPDTRPTTAPATSMPPPGARPRGRRPR
ncbi:MAG TPA: TolC family protein [Tepidisphaeraceae bacterium]